MKPESKRPATWANPQPQVMAMAAAPNPNRERIEARTAEMKAALDAKLKK